MGFINNFFIKINSKKVGADEFGNQYFEKKNGKRFVIYNGIAEATKIPINWHGWMHYSTSELPTKSRVNRFFWQQIHLPNLTGTKNSYSPKIFNQNKRKSHYEPWESN
jgi:NADH:ubiquinone oxidoreductase subunit